MDVGKCFAQLWPKWPSNHMLQVCLRCTLDVKTPRTHFLLNGIRSCANGVCDDGIRWKSVARVRGSVAQPSAQSWCQNSACVMMAFAGSLLRVSEVPWRSLLLSLGVKTPRTHYLLNGIRSFANGVCDVGIRWKSVARVRGSVAQPSAQSCSRIAAGIARCNHNRQ